MDTSDVQVREPRNHVFIIDGTLSRVGEEDCMTHAGRLYRMIERGTSSARQSIGYSRGVQGEGLQKWLSAAVGMGINEAIIQGYATLASRYRPDDRIFLFGYSRGAYAVRSIAGLIEHVGLLRANEATERRVQRAFRHYTKGERTPSMNAFREQHCHPKVEITCIGAWDTVKSLGLPVPGLSRFFPMATDFHDHALGSSVKSAFQALAADEDRNAYEPILWEAHPKWRGQLEQTWFPGAHADIGGDYGDVPAAKPLGTLSFVWMLERAEKQGLLLPDGWRSGFNCDPTAPQVGSRRGMNRLFLIRRPRVATLGMHGERAHSSITARMGAIPDYTPRAKGLADEAVNPAYALARNGASAAQ